jgi:hypothetical protein
MNTYQYATAREAPQEPWLSDRLYEPAGESASGPLLGVA